MATLPLLGSASAPAFCSTAEGLAQWSAANGCNGLPQFESAFCASHAFQSSPSRFTLLLDNATACAAAAGSACAQRTSVGAQLTSPQPGTTENTKTTIANSFKYSCLCLSLSLLSLSLSLSRFFSFFLSEYEIVISTLVSYTSKIP